MAFSFFIQGKNGAREAKLFLWVHSFLLEKKESGGLDDTFGGGSMLTETLAASIVTSVKPQNTSFFQTPNHKNKENELELLPH